MQKFKSNIFLNIRNSFKHFTHVSYFLTWNILFNWRFTKNVDLL